MSSLQRQYSNAEALSKFPSIPIQFQTLPISHYIEPLTAPAPPVAATSSSNIESPISAKKEEEIKNILFKCVMKEDWDDVISCYRKHKSVVQTAQITRAKETALHVAISNGINDVVKDLLDIIDPYKIRTMINDGGENPLHLAASLGQVEICRLIVQKDVELIGMRNEEGETPLFHAALHGKKGAFYALHPPCPLNPSLYLKHDVAHCKRSTDGNTILHVAILGEYFELAFQIINWYPELIKYKNVKGQSALHYLAQNPSAFRSGCHLGPLDDFIYRCLIIDPIKEEMPSDFVDEHQSDISIQAPKNYRTCLDLLKMLIKALKMFIKAMGKYQKQDVATPNPENVGEQGENCLRDHIKVYDILLSTPRPLYPPNYYTFFSLLGFALELSSFIPGLGPFVRKIKEKKQKHKLTLELMMSLVRLSTAWEYMDNGSYPSNVPHNFSLRMPHFSSDFFDIPGEDTQIEQLDRTTQYIGRNVIKEIISEMQGKKIQVEAEKAKPVVYNLQMLSMNSQRDGDRAISVFLISSMMGVTEIVEEILKAFPRAINDLDANNKNVLLLVAEYKQPAVCNLLLKTVTNAMLFKKVDKEGNNALHLAAAFGKSKTWHAYGVALQMQCELKWYQFIKDHSPPCGVNSKGETPNEIFIETHTSIVKEAQQWLTSTSNACSVVVTVVATVAYASVTDLQSGKNKLDMSLRNAFVIFSLVSICSSVASLGMFLSILTSSFEMMDFLYNLPSKLILGLTLLFLSISAMLVSFSISHFFVAEDQPKMTTTLPIYAIVCIPITLFAGALFPLYFSVIRSTFTQPKRRNQTTTLN